MHIENQTKKRGRPKSNEEIDYIFSELWYWDLEEITGLDTPTKITRKVIPKEFKTKNAAGQFSFKTAILNRVQNGKRVPPPWLIKKTMKKLGDPYCWLAHPLRKLTNPNKMDTNQIYALLLELEPDVFKLIFHENTNNPDRPFRYTYTNNTLEELDQKSNLDALTACIGLMRESYYFGFEQQYHDLAKKALNIFLRVVIQHPFNSVADKLFNNFCTHIFHHYADKSWINNVKKINIKKRILYGERVLKLVTHVNLLKLYDTPPLTCIYFAEKQLSIEQLNTLWKYKQNNEIEKIISCSEFKIFSSYLRIWEQTQISPMFVPPISHSPILNWSLAECWSVQTGITTQP